MLGKPYRAAPRLAAPRRGDPSPPRIKLTSGRHSYAQVTPQRVARDPPAREAAFRGQVGAGQVLMNASGSRVVLSDGRHYSAGLVAMSQDHDLEVLRIGLGISRPLPVALGTSHDLEVEQKVFAIGNPLDLDWTLTNGIVCALNRSLTEKENRAVIEHLI